MNTEVKGLLEQREEVQEQLLAFGEYVFHGIDHRNAEQLAKGIEFIRVYNEKLADFGKAADELSGMIQQYTHVSVEETSAIPSTDRARFERIIRDLDPATPHYLNEDFTYK